MKHTPTPYDVNRVCSEGIAHFTIIDQRGKVIVDTFNSEVAEIHEEWDHDSDGNSWRNQWDEQGRVDVEFIVRACNAHDELLEALKYARRFLKPGEHDTAYIDEIIAKATGK